VIYQVAGTPASGLTANYCSNCSNHMPRRSSKHGPVVNGWRRRQIDCSATISSVRRCAERLLATKLQRSSSPSERLAQDAFIRRTDQLTARLFGRTRGHDFVSMIGGLGDRIHSPARGACNPHGGDIDDRPGRLHHLLGKAATGVQPFRFTSNVLSHARSSSRRSAEIRVRPRVVDETFTRPNFVSAPR